MTKSEILNIIQVSILVSLLALLAINLNSIFFKNPPSWLLAIEVLIFIGGVATLLVTLFFWIWNK